MFHEDPLGKLSDVMGCVSIFINWWLFLFLAWKNNLPTLILSQCIESLFSNFFIFDHTWRIMIELSHKWCLLSFVSIQISESSYFLFHSKNKSFHFHHFLWLMFIRIFLFNLTTYILLHEHLERKLSQWERILRQDFFFSKFQKLQRYSIQFVITILSGSLCHVFKWCIVISVPSFQWYYDIIWVSLTQFISCKFKCIV
jgi:hypothetical protein